MRSEQIYQVSTALIAGAVLFSASDALGQRGQTYRESETERSPRLESPRQANQSGVRTQEQRTTRGAQQRQAVMSWEQTRKASQIIGSDVYSREGDRVGRVNNLIVDVKTGRAPFAIVASGGAWRLGTSDVLVPTRALAKGKRSDEVLLPTTEEELTQPDRQPPPGWSGLSRLEWAEDIDGYWNPGGRTTRLSRERQLPADRGTRDRQYARSGESRERMWAEREDLRERDYASNLRQSGKASDLIGKEVRSPQGQVLGTISDLIVDLESGRAPFAILKHGGTLGVGGTQVLVPIQEFQVNGGENVILNATEQQLRQATSEPTGAWDRVRQADWAGDVDAFFGRPGVATGVSERSDREFIRSQEQRGMRGTERDRRQGGARGYGDVNRPQEDIAGGTDQGYPTQGQGAEDLLKLAD